MGIERANISDVDTMDLPVVGDAIRRHQTDIAAEILGEVVFKKKNQIYPPPIGKPQEVPVIRKSEVEKKHIKKDGKR